MDDGVGPGLFSVAMRVAAEGELMAMQRAPQPMPRHQTHPASPRRQTLALGATLPQLALGRAKCAITTGCLFRCAPDFGSAGPAVCT